MMFTLYPKEELGRANHGWLDSRFHFSFADYYNPKRMHFGVLRVVNDDWVHSGTGFDLHPHKDMEIITYVRSGSILHRDSLGNEGSTSAGNVQVMSAGTGIVHAEYASPDTNTTLYQIWIIPKEKGVTPRWEQAQFPQEPVQDDLNLLVSGNPDDASKGALFIHQNARIYGGRLENGTIIRHPVHNQAYILVSAGTISVSGNEMRAGDGAEITNVEDMVITATDDAEVLVIDVPRT